MTRTAVAYAHVPGGGPEGKHCRDCGHAIRPAWRLDGKPRTRCLKAADLIRLHVLALAPVRRASPACKYFEERKA